jgi:riboflavin kinase / FMN adenylyltransferase
MIVLNSIGELATLPGPIVLAAGTFDGVHRGHQALIRRAMEEASSCGGTAVVMTFDRHPASLIRPERAPRLLTRNPEKFALLEQTGIPALLMIRFDRDFASIPASDFIDSLVASCKPLRALCVGSEWFFGKGGEGDVALLKQLGAELCFFVIRIDPVEAGGTQISSTRIRAAIAAGNFDEAEACLGRPFRLLASVISGAGLGSKIGFPTANLNTEGLQLPPNGVYAVKAFWKSDALNGVCNIGLRPTVDDSPTSTKRPVLEVHLFDYSGNLVGEELSLEFVKFLRPEQKFSGLEELKSQIARDCSKVKLLLSA